MPLSERGVFPKTSMPILKTPENEGTSPEGSIPSGWKNWMIRLLAARRLPLDRPEPAGSENIPNADPSGTQPRRNNAPEKNCGYREGGHSDAAT